MGYKDKNKQKEYQRKWMKQRREEFFLGKVCENCSSSLQLVLHHSNTAEKESHRIWSWSEKRRNYELEKCVVLCDKCHIEYHAESKRLKEYHGTITGYRHYACRCPLCKAAQSKAMKEYMKTRILKT